MYTALRRLRFGTSTLLSIALMFFSSAAFSSDVIRANGEPVISTKAEPVITWRAASAVSDITIANFTPLSESTLKNLREENSDLGTKRIKIGVSRNAETEVNDTKLVVSKWQNTGDAYIARLAVTSPEAKALRIGLRLHALPDSAELRFAGSDAPENIIGVVSGKEANHLRDEHKVYWTPATDGETQTIEIYLPMTINLENVKIKLEAASHLFTSAQEGFNVASVVKASQYCEVDVACKFSSLGTAFQNTSKAVARMVYTEAGSSYTCTGTLLNDTASSQTPYFWSAAHCISTQSVANTLITHWFYEAASCSGSQRNSNYRTLSGGAQLLHVNKSADTLLLRLNNSAPSGAWLAGWDADRFSSGSMIGIHHPNGDFKKVSQGNGTGSSCSSVNFGDSPVSGSSLSEARWTEGSTEGGSSGSGLFTLSGGQYFLRGGLMGGTASCYNMAGRDCYSRLDLVYDEIKQYLSPSSSTFGPTREYGGAWYNPGEAGWGLMVFQYSSIKHLFVGWYTFDDSGKPVWYIFQGANWTANDTYTAPVIRYTGPAWGSTFLPSEVKSSTIGTATLTFTSATTGKFQYNVNGISRSIDVYKLE